MPVWILQDIWEVLNTEKASHRWRAAAGFFVVEGGEISNLDLIRDIDRIIKLDDDLSENTNTST